MSNLISFNEKDFDLNTIDLILMTLMIIYIFGMVLSYRYEFLAGFILTLCSLLYVIIHDLFLSSWFFDIRGYYLIIPGILFIVIGYVQNDINLNSIEFERLKNELADIQQSNTLANSMLGIVPDMIRNDDLDFILQKVLEKTIQSIPKAQAGSIILKIDNHMEFRAAVGYDLNLLQKLELKFEDILQYKLGLIHDPVIINDVETYNVKDVYQHATVEFSEENQIVSKAMMTHVIMYKREIFGFINIDNLEDPKAFSTKDINVIKRVTKHIESIIENQVLIENVYKMSRYDALTGAYTRRYYQEQVIGLYKESIKKSKSFSIITFDLDDLKQKNDIHGHEAGDLYLLSFANLIRDVMPKQSFLSRVGGDEFVLVIPNSNHELAYDIVKSIETKCAETPFTYDHESLYFKYSYGISSFPNDTEDLELLKRLSDQRMYENKRKKETQ
ncbi:MAG: GGDEF domain-containing protein [Acholeplasmataceae bacterium]